ncbi:MAG: ABC transporter permease, partial [Planctomycetota bacterium]
MMMSRIGGVLLVSLRSLWMHRLRSGLTTLGIVFGVASVIAMLAIGEGASRQAQEQIAHLGSTNIILKTVKPPDTGVSDSTQQVIQEYGLTFDDAERFRQTVADAQVVVPVRRMPQQVWYRSRKVMAQIVGTVPWYPDSAPVDIVMGRFLSSMDMHYNQAYCIVDETIMDTLFKHDDPMNQAVKIAGEYYHVIGVVRERSVVIEGEGNGNGFGASSNGGGV